MSGLFDIEAVLEGFAGNFGEDVLLSFKCLASGCCSAAELATLFHDKKVFPGLPKGMLLLEEDSQFRGWIRSEDMLADGWRGSTVNLADLEGGQVAWVCGSSDLWVFQRMEDFFLWHHLRK